MLVELYDKGEHELMEEPELLEEAELDEVSGDCSRWSPSQCKLEPCSEHTVTCLCTCRLGLSRVDRQGQCTLASHRSASRVNGMGLGILLMWTWRKLHSMHHQSGKFSASQLSALV